MAPLPENNSARVWLKYTSAGVEHELMFRLPANIATAVNAANKADALGAVLVGSMHVGDSVLSARWSPSGSNFSVPLPLSTQQGELNVAFWPQDPESVQYSLTGRSFTDGRDVTWQFFSPVTRGTWPNDNRFQPGESAPVDTFRINFTAWVADASVPGQQVVTIGNTIPTVNAYVNIRSNGYWQNAQR